MAVPLRLGVWQTVALGRHRTLLLFPTDTVTGPLWLSVRGEGSALLELTADDRSPPDRPYEVRVRRGMGEVHELPAQVRVRRGECCLSAPEDETVVQVRVAGAPTDDLHEPAVPVGLFASGGVVPESLFVQVAGDVSRLAGAVTSAERPRAAPTLPPEPEPVPEPPRPRTLPEGEPLPEFDLMPEPEPTPPPAPAAEAPKKGFFGRRR